MLRRRLVHLLVAAAACYACHNLSREYLGAYSPLVFLPFAPLLAWTASRFVIELLQETRRSAHASVLAQWSGRYYTFDERQVRFYLVNQSVWTSSDDLARILEPPPGERELRLLGEHHAAIPGANVMACSEAGLSRLLEARTGARNASYHMVRFRNWIETQALPNVKRLPSSATAIITIDDGEADAGTDGA